MPYPPYQVTFVAGNTTISFNPHDKAIRGTHAFVLSANGGAVALNVEMSHNNESADLIPKLIVKITDVP